MASKPEDEHAYILDSFEEFEALARRALHEGKQLLEYALKKKPERQSIHSFIETITQHCR